jgi:hypothetical protein
MVVRACYIRKAAKPYEQFVLPKVSDPKSGVTNKVEIDLKGQIYASSPMPDSRYLTIRCCQILISS